MAQCLLTVTAMLRITLHDSPEALTFQVEGRLVGAWATELEQFWKTVALLHENRARIVDLTGTLFIDGEGRRVLTSLFRQGASFRTACPMTEAIVAEIASGSPMPEIALKRNPQVRVANL